MPLRVRPNFLPWVCTVISYVAFHDIFDFSEAFLPALNQ